MGASNEGFMTVRQREGRRALLWHQRLGQGTASFKFALMPVFLDGSVDATWA